MNYLCYNPPRVDFRHPHGPDAMGPADRCFLFAIFSSAEILLDVGGCVLNSEVIEIPAKGLKMKKVRRRRIVR